MYFIGLYLILLGKGLGKAMRQICSSGVGWGGLGSKSVHEQGCWYELCSKSVREDGVGELFIKRGLGKAIRIRLEL